MPLALATPSRIRSASLERPPRNARARSKRPWGGPAVAPERPSNVSPAAPVSRRGGRRGAPAPPPRLRGGTHQGRGGGDRTLEDLREAIRELDRETPICPRCRRRPRQYKGLNRWTGCRDYRMLCARCQRGLRVAAGYQDLPAPTCRSCWRRPRALKEYRRGRPRYRATCWPCDHTARAARGLPSHPGTRSARGDIARTRLPGDRLASALVPLRRTRSLARSQRRLQPANSALPTGLDSPQSFAMATCHPLAPYYDVLSRLLDLRCTRGVGIQYEGWLPARWLPRSRTRRRSCGSTAGS